MEEWGYNKVDNGVRTGSGRFLEARKAVKSSYNQLFRRVKQDLFFYHLDESNGFRVPITRKELPVSGSILVYRLTDMRNMTGRIVYVKHVQYNNGIASYLCKVYSNDERRRQTDCYVLLSEDFVCLHHYATEEDIQKVKGIPGVIYKTP